MRYAIALAILLTACKQTAPITVTIPEQNIEGEAPTVEASPDSLEDPCKYLITLLELQRLRHSQVDTVVVEVATPPKPRKPDPELQKAVESIREAVCLWNPVDTTMGGATLRIWPLHDGTPAFSVTCAEQEVTVICPDPGVAEWWRTAAIFCGVLVMALLMLFRR